MLCVNTELGVRFIVQLLSLSPVLWSLLYNIELVFIFSVLFLVFWINYSSRYIKKFHVSLSSSSSSFQTTKNDIFSSTCVGDSQNNFSTQR